MKEDNRNVKMLASLKYPASNGKKPITKLGKTEKCVFILTLIIWKQGKHELKMKEHRWCRIISLIILASNNAVLLFQFPPKQE